MTTTSTTNIVLLVLIVNFVCALSCADAVFAQKGARRGASRMGNKVNKRRKGSSQTTAVREDSEEEPRSWDLYGHQDPNLLGIDGAELFEGDIVVTPDDHCWMRAFGFNFAEPAGGCDEESSSLLSSTPGMMIVFRIEFIFELVFTFCGVTFSSVQYSSIEFNYSTTTTTQQ